MKITILCKLGFHTYKNWESPLSGLSPTLHVCTRCKEIALLKPDSISRDEIITLWIKALRSGKYDHKKIDAIGVLTKYILCLSWLDALHASILARVVESAKIPNVDEYLPKGMTRSLLIKWIEFDQYPLPKIADLMEAYYRYEKGPTYIW